jgi:FkbM family methyltransferase
MNPMLNRDTVTLAYQLLLGRLPESDQVVTEHMQLGTLEKLRVAIIASKEYKAKTLHSQFETSQWVCVDVLDRYAMWLDLHDRYVSHGCLQNNWEPDETSFFESRLHHGATVLDIGANIGWFSLVAAKNIGPTGKVHAFEPRSETTKMLRRTVAQNFLGSVIEVWEYALSDKSEEVQLLWSKNTDNPGHSFMMDAKGGDKREKELSGQRILACSLDTLLPDIAPDVIKIDVEGAEPKALIGAKNAIARKKPVILSELFPEQIERVSSKTCAAFIAMMEEIGYQCYWLQQGKPTQRLRDYPADSKRELESVIFEWRG